MNRKGGVLEGREVRAVAARAAMTLLPVDARPERPEREFGHLERLNAQRNADDGDHRTNPISTQEITIANPPKTIHRILPMILIAGSLRSTIFRKTPDGISDLHSMVLV